MMTKGLVDLAGKLHGRRVTVIGDVMLDHFLIGRIERISPEAPVPVVRVDRDDFRLGGAANVAHNVQALGGQAVLVGLVGDDEASGQLRRALQAAGISDQHLVVDRSRRTTRKVRVVGGRSQQVIRLDYEDDADPSAAVAAALNEQLHAAIRDAGVIVLSDYRKGVVSPAVIAATLAAAASAHTTVLIDPKVPQAARYRGATVLTPNHHEAEVMTGLSIQSSDAARRAARMLSEATGASVVITWGEQGMWLLDVSRDTHEEAHFPAAAREVADVTGAGDTVIGVLALSIAAGARLADAARLANLAAGLVVARFGPAVVTLDELTAALERPGP